jgi:hypothetical protein
MKNRYHLVIETPDGNLSQGMRHLNGVYTQAFNRRHKRVGHVLQGRYEAIVIQKESHLLEVCRYVVNPRTCRAHRYSRAREVEQLSCNSGKREGVYLFTDKVDTGAIWKKGERG